MLGDDCFGLAVRDGEHVAAAEQDKEHDGAGGKECSAPDPGDMEAVDERLLQSPHSVGLPPLDESTSAVLLAANVESSARPSAPPTCCEVLKSPDARPASSTGMPLVAISVSGTKVRPIPIEVSMIPGRMSAR